MRRTKLSEICPAGKGAGAVAGAGTVAGVGASAVDVPAATVVACAGRGASLERSAKKSEGCRDAADAGAREMTLVAAVVEVTVDEVVAARAL